MTVTIYALRDPDTNDVKYIGATVRTLARRLDGHMSKPKRASPRDEWIWSLRASGKRPSIEALEVASEDDAETVECFWIAQARGLGWPILNVCRGGKGFTAAQTPEHKGKIRSALLGREIRWRDKISAARMGHEVSPETRARIAATISGGTLLETTTGKKYATATEAARELGLQPSHVSRVARGDRPHTRGYVFVRVPTASGGDT